MSENDLKNVINWASKKIRFYEKILKMMKESYSRFDFYLFVISDSGKRINLDEIEVKRSEAILGRIKEMTSCLQNIFEIHKKSGLSFKEICKKMEVDFITKHDHSSVLHFLEKIRKNLEDEDEMLIDIWRLEPFSPE